MLIDPWKMSPSVMAFKKLHTLCKFGCLSICCENLQNMRALWLDSLRFHVNLQPH